MVLQLPAHGPLMVLLLLVVQRLLLPLLLYPIAMAMLRHRADHPYLNKIRSWWRSRKGLIRYDTL